MSGRPTILGTVLCAFAPMAGAAPVTSLVMGPEVRVTPPTITRPVVEPIVVVDA